MTDKVTHTEPLEPERPAMGSLDPSTSAVMAGMDDTIALNDVGSPEELERLYEESLKHIQEGEIVRGRIVQIDRDAVLVDVGYKSEGIIDLAEFPDYGRDLQVGQEVDVLLEEKEDREGQVILSKEKANRIKIWDDISKKYDNNEIIEGVVVTRIKGGLTVDVGLKAFLPGSQIDLRPVRNLDRLIGEKLQMRIIKLNKRRGNIVLSRRVLLKKTANARRKRLWHHWPKGRSSKA
jgi:small subunit ribosomal protein S1